jgi:hypothetical protein
MKCPKCGEECDREEVDVGVGVLHGPWGCLNCGCSSDSNYDCSAEWSKDQPRRDPENPEFVVDPLGGMCRAPVKGEYSDQ